MKTLKHLLIELEACKESIEWVQDKTIEQAVTECEHADWILWLAEKVQCDKRKLVLCVGLCANTVRHLMKDERSIKAVDTAIYYGNGNATEQDLYTARAAAWDAAWAAARAAARDAARDAAWDAAWAAAWDAASAAARDAALKEMSEIIRPVIADELIQKVNELLQ